MLVTFNVDVWEKDGTIFLSEREGAIYYKAGSAVMHNVAGLVCRRIKELHPLY